MFGTHLPISSIFVKKKKKITLKQFLKMDPGHSSRTIPVSKMGEIVLCSMFM
jgi:hypothetical protein